VAFYKSMCFDKYHVGKTTKQVHKNLILFQTDILTFYLKTVIPLFCFLFQVLAVHASWYSARLANV